MRDLTHFCAMHGDLVILHCSACRDAQLRNSNSQISKSNNEFLAPDMTAKIMTGHIKTGPRSGVKHDGGKPLLALIPAHAIEEEGKVWTFGANKYGNHNWRKGLTYVRILSALLRHAFALVRGEDLDPESGLHHGAHIRCNAGMLVDFYYEGRTELDDRYKKGLSNE